MGYALYCTRFPDSADPVPEFDTPQRAERLEMAHFASEEQAKRFETEFRSYLVPGLIDGPELAEEVAKLEGMVGGWRDMDNGVIVDYMRRQAEQSCARRRKGRCMIPVRSGRRKNTVICHTMTWTYKSNCPVKARLFLFIPYPIG